MNSQEENMIVAKVYKEMTGFDAPKTPQEATEEWWQWSSNLGPVVWATVRILERENESGTSK